MQASDLSRRLRRAWLDQSFLIRIIIINVAIFLVISIGGILARIGGHSVNGLIDFLALPSNLIAAACRPWTAMTYMFTHYDAMHILFNMLVLYGFGTLFTFRCTSRQLVALYIYGGVAGAALYLIAATALHGMGGYLLGASASVMAITIATAVLMPDYQIRLFFIWQLKLKWVAIIAVASFALGLVGNNAGGHIAHLGGMIMGLIFALMLNRGRDITKPFNQMLDRFVNFMKGISRHSPRKKRFGIGYNAAPKAQTSEADDIAELDAILDKIKKSGYSALTAKEKQRLFDVSRRVNNPRR